jgi:hypothetical protein
MKTVPAYSSLPYCNSTEKLKFRASSKTYSFGELKIIKNSLILAPMAICKKMVKFRQKLYFWDGEENAFFHKVLSRVTKL